LNTNISGGQFRLRPAGTGRPIAAKQKPRFIKFEFQNLKSQNENLKTFTTIFCEIDREILSRKIVFLFSRSAARRPLKQCPYEATTSIWLKAMTVCRDLRGNIAPSENGIRHGGGDWEPEGRSPEGQVGVDSDRRPIS
jgi:hypothetical protein